MLLAHDIIWICSETTNDWIAANFYIIVAIILIWLHLLTPSVNILSSSNVPWVSYRSSRTVQSVESFVKAILLVENWGSNAARTTQK